MDTTHVCTVASSLHPLSPPTHSLPFKKAYQKFKNEPAFSILISKFAAKDLFCPYMRVASCHAIFLRELLFMAEIRSLSL